MKKYIVFNLGADSDWELDKDASKYCDTSYDKEPVTNEQLGAELLNQQASNQLQLS
jgi:hypothetical protein